MALTLPFTLPQIIRTHKKKTIVAVIVILLAGLGIWRLTRPAQPVYVTAVATKGDLRQTVEAVGTVVSERELELRFGASGIVSSVSVREGDRVVAGQRLAQLKAGSLGANVASQQAALASSMADLQAMEEGSRPEDIAISQADLDNKKAALAAAEQTLESSELNITQSQQQLDTIRAEANVNLAGQVSTSFSTINEQLITVENALSTIDDVLSRTDVNDAVVKSRPQAPGEIRAQQRTAADAITAARAVATRAGTDYQAAIGALGTARDAANGGSVAINALFSLISSLQESQYFSTSARESLKTSIATDRSAIQDAAGNISSALSSLQNAAAAYDTKIAAQQSTIINLQGARDKAKTDILTYQSGVRSAEAALRLKQAGARQTDLDAARARVRQAQANLARTQADYGDTILTAPVSGIVTHVNIRIGESLPTGAAVTLLGESPYRVEMFVSEIDIPKVALTQSGSIELDAFRGTHFALHVGDIDPSATDKDGVSKYRVRLDFAYPHDELKIGMTGDAEIVTGQRSNVISIPQRAVIENEKGKTIVRVLHDDKTVEEREVETGMEAASGDIEVTGIKEGETVIVLEKK